MDIQPGKELALLKQALGADCYARLDAFQWAKKAVFRLSEEKQIYLFEIAASVIGNGGLKGNVSDAWRSLGYTTFDIPDLY